MLKAPKKIIDSVSASELLKALSTLQHMGQSDDAEISFSDDSKMRPQARGNNGRVINFDQYMARKDDGKKKNNGNLQRKSISPLRDDNGGHTIKLADLKSRSHSPLCKKPQKTERSMLVTQKKTKPQQQSQYIKNSKENKENKENKREQPTISNKDNLYRASFQSKRILDQRQKKGSAYVPIQLRTEQLMREKQAKLARLQKEQEMNNILREKECTFKPNIIKTYKKGKASIVKQEEKLQKIEEESVRFDDGVQENQFLCTPTHPVHTNDSIADPSEYLFPIQHPPQSHQHAPSASTATPTPPARKYKNDKFNILLDLIH